MDEDEEEDEDEEDEEDEEDGDEDEEDECIDGGRDEDDDGNMLKFDRSMDFITCSTVPNPSAIDISSVGELCTV